MKLTDAVPAYLLDPEDSHYCESLATFISDGGDMDRVDATLEFTPALIADDAASVMLIGTQVRDMLREGKAVFVKTHRLPCENCGEHHEGICSPRGILTPVR